MANLTTHLFDLIKTLTPSEKKLVMKYAFPYKKGGDSMLRKLFQLVDKQFKYDEKPLKEKIKNLPTRKLELWKKIMLVLQTNNNSIEIVKARRKFDFIHILASKQLFDQIPDMLEELKQWGIAYNQPYYTAIALQYESALQQSIYDQHAIEHMSPIRMQILETAEQIFLTAQVYEYYMRVAELDRSNQIIRDGSIIERAKKLEHDPLHYLPIDRMSLQSLCTYNDAKSTILFLQRKFIESFKVETISRRAFQAKKNKTVVDIYNYCTWLTNLMSVHAHLSDYVQWEEDVIALNDIVIEHFSDDLIRVSKANLFTFWFHYRKNKFKDAQHLIKTTEQYYRVNKNLLAEEDVKFHEWNFVIAFFDMKDYDKSWKYCNEWINKTSADVMPQVQEFMRMFFLFILLEKKEWAYLTNRSKQYEKFIGTKDKTLYVFDILVIAFMKKMKSAKNLRGEQRKLWIWLLEEINKLYDSENLYTKEVLLVFDFREWINRCKIDLSP